MRNFRKFTLGIIFLLLTFLCVLYAKKNVVHKIEKILSSDKDSTKRATSRHNGFARRYLRDAAQKQEEYFEKNHKYFSCQNQECFPDREEDYSFFGLRVVVLPYDNFFTAEAWHTVTNKRFSWISNQGGLQKKDSTWKDPYDPYEKLSKDDVAKEVLRDLTASQLAHYILEGSYVSCKNIECGDKLSRYKYVPDSVEVEMLGNDRTFTGTVKHRNSSVSFYTNHEIKLPQIKKKH